MSRTVFNRESEDFDAIYSSLPVAMQLESWCWHCLLLCGVHCAQTDRNAVWMLYCATVRCWK